MKTVRLTMAQALLKFLDNQYISVDGQERKFVKGVFGIFGHGNVTGIGEALENFRGDLTYYQGKNEQGMAHAAIAYAKQKNRLEIFACTSSIGPGALNMVTAAGTATVNRIPVLFLPGDIFACRQPDPVLQQIENPADYTISANDAFKPVSKYWDRIVRPEQLMTALLNAMRVLTDPVTPAPSRWRCRRMCRPKPTTIRNRFSASGSTISTGRLRARDRSGVQCSFCKARRSRLLSPAAASIMRRRRKS